MIGLLFKSIFGGVMELGSTWLKGRQAKQAAKAQMQMNIANGQISYNVAAQHGMAGSWKDEWLTVWTTFLVTAHFLPFPKVQTALVGGWEALANTAPDWFGYCFVGMYVAIFGLKGWKIFKNGG